jgi:hypothetical protein
MIICTLFFPSVGDGDRTAPLKSTLHTYLCPSSLRADEHNHSNSLALTLQR